ncbi:hypothetical protein [uncultured Paracoccus sp.]|uniref:DUF5801 repeats-in-toxin domain-containing protein n=1 Tax=uncultured Paracoccus sp. TaxID=189685 RepID=UPI0026229874|nr:hypothetical protein [uncultured Paracoccus sp.]
MLYSSIPSAFATRLRALSALATAIGAAESSGNVVTFTPTGELGNVALTDANGDLLDGTDSGLVTTAGEAMLLYTYTTNDNDPINDNIVLGRAGGPTGDIVFAICLEETGGTPPESAKLWTVQYEAIDHGDDGNDHDSAVDLLNKIYVTASESFVFPLDTLASGQNAWSVFGTDASQIIVIPDQAGQTVNTSQGGGSTTIANSNQLMDGVGSSEDADGNALVFTFVSNSPGLFALDKKVTSDITYDSLLPSTGAEWSISQTQGGSDYAVVDGGTLDGEGDRHELRIGPGE